MDKRIADGVEVDAITGCWVWQKCIAASGYGRIKVRENGVSRTDYTHRVAYEHFIGPIPGGLDLDHLCRNRACCNPHHLEPVTRRENLLRGVGPSALNTVKAECDAGHPFDETNTAYLPDGRRRCRACAVRRTREWQARRAG
jgi:hypothetical protein